MTETIKELHPVARKPHRCDFILGKEQKHTLLTLF